MLLGIPVVSKNTYPQRSFLGFSSIVWGHKKTMDTTKWKRRQFTQLIAQKGTCKGRMNLRSFRSGTVFFCSFKVMFYFVPWYNNKSPFEKICVTCSKQLKPIQGIRAPRYADRFFGLSSERRVDCFFLPQLFSKFFQGPPFINQNPPNTLWGGA